MVGMKALHPDDVARVTQRISDSRAAGGPYEAEYRVRRASDGSYRWHLARSMPMKDKDGKIIGWFGSATDIDDQKRVEAALRESEERFRKVFEEGPLGVLLVGTDGRIQQATGVSARSSGIRRVKSSPLGWLASLTPTTGRGTYPLFLALAWRNLVLHVRNAIFAKMAKQCGVN